MNKFLLLFIPLILISFTNASNKIIYIEPCSGAKLVNIENNVIIGFERPLTLSVAEISNCVHVNGSLSGPHAGRMVLTSDKSRIIYIPDTFFSAGENVTVSLSGKLLKDISGERKFSYSFETRFIRPEWNSSESFYNETGINFNKYENPVIYDPPVLPQLTVTVNNNPENGFIFLSNFRRDMQSNTPYLIITDKNGLPYSYYQLGSQAYDFKKQPNGNLTYASSARAKFYELAPDFTELDSFYCGNGYRTDIHELRVLSNRHALLLSYDAEIVNMSQFVNGGDTAANVIGLIVQEIDENKNVVFQWRSWDHFTITDAIHENLLAHTIDYVHGNAIELDNDGNLIISSRHLDEITKIDRSNGAIIWRLGGNKNQFSFVNDPIGFSHQHAIRRISNGNITLFDNGNFHSPHFSRAVEYSLNEMTKVATLIWEYKNTPAIYGDAMGYVQRLPGGNTLISWGTANPTVTEVTPQGTIAFQMTLPLGTISYRAFKFDWNGQPTSNTHESGLIPAHYSLHQNYPNPFNPSTTIEVDIPEEAYTVLAIYDITGRELEKLASENLKAGSYKFRFDGGKYSSGLYFYRLTAGKYSSVQKMIFVK